jgi:hypothetical protein
MNLPDKVLGSAGSSVTNDSITISAGPRLRTAMIVAIVADLLQLVIFPLTIAGAVSPAEDILDVGVAAILSFLLGWHWEFLPSFVGKLVPGVDLVPFWTIAVANVYRKSKQQAVHMETVSENKNTQHS